MMPLTIPPSPGLRQPSVGEHTFDPLHADGTVTMSTGILRLTYFQAVRTETITSLAIVTGATAAAATPTLVRAGVYLASASDWSLGTLKATTNDTTLLAAATTEYTKALASSLSKIAGQWYAFAVLVVTAATAPTVVGMATTAAAQFGSTNGRPRTAAQVAAQTDLPATVAAGSLAATTVAPYGLLVP